MLVALDVPGVATNLQDHVFDTAAAGEHPVGYLENIKKWKLLLSVCVSVWNK